MPPITTPAGQDSPGPGTATSVSAPLWRRVFQGGRERLRPRIDNVPSARPSNLPAASPNTVAHNLTSSETTPSPIHPGPNEDTISPVQKPEFPRWSVVYNPEVDRAFDLQLAHTFKYDASLLCVGMSPDGQRLAVGFASGETYLYELETGSNIWLVTQPLDLRFGLI